MESSVDLSCIVISYNSGSYLKACINALKALGGLSKEIILVDNASNDNGIEIVKKHFSDVKIIPLAHNAGYSGGANVGIKESCGEYVMIVNPDIVVNHDYAGLLIRDMKKDVRIAAATGKLVNNGVIDSAGLVIYKNRRCVDRGQGMPDAGQFDKPAEIFGVSGACPIYRRKALDDVKIFGEYFDEDFFMYKEDVDLSWRIRLLGWKCWYQPKAVASHKRGTGIFDRSTLGGTLKNRNNLSKMQKSLSYRNERWLRIKNDIPGLVLKNIGRIAMKEILHFGYALFYERCIFGEAWNFMKMVPKMLRKRDEIFKRKRVGAREMEKWFE